MTDYISMEKIWQDVFCYQVKFTCASSHVVVTNDIYVSDDSIDSLFNGLNDFVKGKTKEFFWKNGEKGDDSTACITFKFIQKDKLGHILIEVYIELDDGGKYSTHNCCFYISTEYGLLETFCKRLVRLKQEPPGIKITLNDSYGTVEPKLMNAD